MCIVCFGKSPERNCMISILNKVYGCEHCLVPLQLKRVTATTEKEKRVLL